MPLRPADILLPFRGEPSEMSATQGHNVGVETEGPHKQGAKGKAPDSKLWLTGLGFELVGAIAGGALLGWWIDRKAGTSPRWLIILAGIGIVGGLYNLIRTALAAGRQAHEEDESARDERR